MESKLGYSLLGLGLGVAIGYQLSRLNQKKENFEVEQLCHKKELIDQQHLVCEKNNEEYQNMMAEQLIRNIQFFGEEGQDKISKSYVIIFGVGGVGSHVAASLARSGVGRIKIVDFDRVSLSSLNRHAFATQADVGRSKVECIADYVKRIMPLTRVDTIEDYVTKDNVETFFKRKTDGDKNDKDEDEQPTYVIDCIDNIDAKVALLAYCRLNGKRVISSMGAGMKADPTRLQIRDISETNYDDLSRAVRQKLRKYKIYDGIKVVLSVERNQRELLPLKEHQESNPGEYKVFSNYRLRIVPVLGTMPALVAYALSSYILCDIAGQIYSPFMIDEVKQANYAKLFNHLQSEARRTGIAFEDMQFDMEDVYILAREIYDWKEIVSDKKVCGGLLVRWNPELPFTPDNFVLLNFQDGKRHVNFTTYKEVQNAFPPEIHEKVQQMKAIYLQFVGNKSVIYK